MYLCSSIYMNLDFLGFQKNLRETLKKISNLKITSVFSPAKSKVIIYQGFALKSRWMLACILIFGKRHSAGKSMPVFPILARKKQTAEVALFVVLRQVYPWGKTPGERVKIHLFRGGWEESLWKTGGGQGEERSLNCHCSSTLSLSLSLLPSI